MQTAETRMVVEASLNLALREAVFLSRSNPERVFWVHAIPCPGCHRHAAALGISDNSVKKPKYKLFTIVNGEVIPRVRSLH